MKPDYNPATSSNSCGPITSLPVTKSEPYAPLGRLGCDPPSWTVEMMIEAFMKKHGDSDFFTLNGDMIGHRISSKIFNQEHKNYDLLMSVHRTI